MVCVVWLCTVVVYCGCVLRLCQAYRLFNWSSGSIALGKKKLLWLQHKDISFISCSS